MLLYRICLVLSCIGLTILAGVFIPGPRDTLNISRRIALGTARIGAVTLQANTILTILTTFQAVLVVLCTTVLIHHLARIWLFLDHAKHLRAGLTAASLDAVFFNYLQMFKRLSYGLDRKDCTIFIISILSLVMAQGSHTIFQLFLVDGHIQSPFDATISVVNTSYIIPTMVQSYMDGTLLSLQATFAGSSALSDGLLDVVGACDINTQRCDLEKETAPLIKCDEKTTECWGQIDVYSDFDMSCISGVLSSIDPNLRGGATQVKSLKSVTTSVPIIYKVGVHEWFWDQELSWSVVEQDQFNRESSAYVNCTISPAWSRRREHSVKGTQEKEIVQVFRRNQTFSIRPTNQTTLLASIPVMSPIVFSKYPSCLGFATPWCVLKMVQSMMATMDAYYGISHNELPRQTKGNPLSRLTTLSDSRTFLLEKRPTGQSSVVNKTVAAIYEMEMKFAVERMYKHILAGQFQKPEGITFMSCTNCAIQATFWVENKLLFMTLMGLVNGIAALCVLISLGLSIVHRSVEFSNIRMIEVVRLEASEDTDMDYEKAEFEVKLRGRGSVRTKSETLDQSSFFRVPYEAV